MANEFPLVTVLMAVYNGEKYLREAIESMLNQSYTNFEFLIINDGSTDSTEEIILSYRDERIRHMKNEQNIKLIASLNKGLDLAEGKYIARMDADDVSLPERLAKQVDFMERNLEYGLLGTWVKTLGLNPDKEIHFKSGHDEIRFELFFHNYLHHPTVMFRKEIIKKNNLKYEDYVHAEDYALWINFCKHTKIQILPEVLLHYRLHNENISEIHQDFQRKQTSVLRKLQVEYLQVSLSDSDFSLYESFIDKNLFYNSQNFTKLLSIVQHIVLMNEQIQMIERKILFHFYNERLKNYIEINAFKMGTDIQHYFTSIFSPSKPNQLKLLIKNKLGLKKIWNS
jgi:glycosyltransferase involved in cell wall biosynthesis